ncbi:MAG: hypothetical protein Fur0022_21260 [Anaerolineales bacterium]
MELDRPILLNLKSKKKRRYSKGLGDLQRGLRGMTKISARSAKAIFKGVDALREASDKSAEKKRDGALRDLAKNLGKATSKSLRTSSRIPEDLGKLLNTRSTRRAVKRQIKIASKLNRRFGIR